jgi:hypothetical protein
MCCLLLIARRLTAYLFPLRVQPCRFSWGNVEIYVHKRKGNSVHGEDTGAVEKGGQVEQVKQVRDPERQQDELHRHQETSRLLSPSESTGAAMRNQQRRTEALLEQTR